MSRELTASDAITPVRISAEDARPVRHRVLRPGQPPERLVYPRDDHPLTLHLGVRTRDAGLVSVASFYNEPIPGTDTHAIRLRGMATLPAFRRLGYARALVSTAFDMLPREPNGHRPTLWCNARISAAGYYEHLGFAQLGEVFDLPDIGAHAVMVHHGHQTSHATIGHV